MSRIALADPATAPSPAKEILAGAKAQLGMVPNLFRALGTAPQALAAYSAMSGALAKGVLDVRTRERIALAVAERNSCEYCLAAHSTIGSMVGLEPAQIAAARRGRSEDPKVDAALKLAHSVIDARGRISSYELDDARKAGLGDAEIVEVIANVALNVFTNYVNSAGRVEVDFPAAAPLADAA